VGGAQLRASPIEGVAALPALPPPLVQKRDVELLTKICDLMEAGDHLVAAPLIEIVRLTALMNPSGIRRYQPEAIIDELLTR
jgi:hypothetical protein